MPLSEHEQRVLQELENALYHQDPDFAARVKSENVYRYAGRYVRWSIAGFSFGLVLMLTKFTTSVLIGSIGVAIMFISLVVCCQNLRRMGKAGLEDLGRSFNRQSLSSAVSGARTKLRDRFRRG